MSGLSLFRRLVRTLDTVHPALLEEITVKMYSLSATADASTAMVQNVLERLVAVDRWGLLVEKLVEGA